MARVLLGVTGSVAAIRTPELFETLRVAGHSVRVVATEPALHFFDHSVIGSAQSEEPSWIGGPLFRDADEWAGTIYRRGDPVLHIELRKWADMLIVAPLDANTLAKFALGLSDNCLTCVFRAWDFSRPVILAPAMNTLMWSGHAASPAAVAQRPRRPACLSRIAGRGLIFARFAPKLVLIARKPSNWRVAISATHQRMAEVSAITPGRPRLVRRARPMDEPNRPAKRRNRIRCLQSDRIEDGNDANPQA